MKRDFVRKSGAVLSLQILGAGLGLAAQPIIARAIGAEQFGIYSILFYGASILALLITCGFPVILLRYFALYRMEGSRTQCLRLLNASLFISGGFGLFLLSAFFVVSNWFDVWTERKHAVIILGVLALVLGVAQLAQDGLRSFGAVGAAHFSALVGRPLILIAIGVILLKVGNNADAFDVILAFIPALALMAAFQLIFLRRKIALVPDECATGIPLMLPTMRLWLLGGMALMLYSALRVLLGRIDLFLLGWMAPPGDVGLYSAASRLAEAITLVSLALSSQYGAKVPDMWQRRDVAGLQRLTSYVARVSFISGLIGALGLIIFGKMVLSWFGREFVDAYPALVLLLAGQLVICLGGPKSLLLTTTGHHWDAARILLIALVVSCVISPIFIAQWGYLGAALASASTTILWNLMLVRAIRKRLGVDSSALSSRRE